MGPAAAQWYREHRCDTDPDTGCWRWRQKYHDTIEYLKIRYDPPRLMITLTNGANTAPDQSAMYIGIVIRPGSCSYEDCINPSHIRLVTDDEFNGMLTAGEFWSADLEFRWNEGPGLRYSMDIGDRHSMSCRIRNVRCHVSSRRSWNYYALRFESLPGFSAGVGPADIRGSSRVSCEGFESADDARAYCEAVVRGDGAEVDRLENQAGEDIIARGEADHLWVDEEGFVDADIEEEVTIGLIGGIRMLFELWAELQQTAPTDPQAEYWKAVIVRAETLANSIYEIVPQLSPGSAAVYAARPGAYKAAQAAIDDSRPTEDYDSCFDADHPPTSAATAEQELSD